MRISLVLEKTSCRERVLANLDTYELIKTSQWAVNGTEETEVSYLL